MMELLPVAVPGGFLNQKFITLLTHLKTLINHQTGWNKQGPTGNCNHHLHLRWVVCVEPNCTLVQCHGSLHNFILSPMHFNQRIVLWRGPNTVHKRADCCQCNGSKPDFCSLLLTFAQSFAIRLLRQNAVSIVVDVLHLKTLTLSLPLWTLNYQPK